MSTLSVNKITDLTDFTFPPTTTLSLVGFNASGTINTANLNITSTSGRITGDFGNATNANRVIFQNSTVNGGSRVSVMPNGTASSSGFEAYSGPSTDPNNASIAVMAAQGTTDARFSSTISGTGTYLPMTFYTGGSERVRIDTSGNVGIGTLSPTYALDVYRSAAAVKRIYSDTSATSIIANYSTDTVGGIAAFYKYRGTNAAPTTVVNGDIASRVVSYGYDGTSLGQVAEIRSNLDATVGTGSTAGRLTFYTTSSGSNTVTERMRIDSSGNMGIGMTPSLPLDITATTGNIRLTSSTGTNYAQLQTINGSGTARFGVEGSGGGSITANSTAYSAVVNQAGAYSLHFGTNNTVRATIDSSGNMGIGTNSLGAGYRVSIVGSAASSVPLYLHSDATNGYVYSPNPLVIGSTGAYTLSLVTNNTTKFLIGSAGQLGIGGATYGTSGQVLTSGGASAAPTWSTVSAGSSAKAWARWDGASGTRTSSYNVSSITRSSAGQYIVNFTTAMADANYAPIMSCAGDSTVYNGYGVFPGMTSAPTTTSFAMWTKSYNGTATDPASVQIAVFGN